MNAQRRKQLAEAITLLYKAQEIIEWIKDEEEEAYDNLPESIQYSDRGEQMSDNVDNLGDISDNLIDYTTTLEEM